MILGNQEQKKDAGKLQYRLLPWKAVSKVVKVLMFGAQKYSEGGWRTVDNAQARYTDAAFRHLIEYADGKKYDVCESHNGVRPDDCRNCSGLLTLAHAACCVLFMLALEDDEQSTH